VSQRQVSGTQRWFPQVKCPAGQVPGIWVGQPRSSLPSKQSLWPSQRQRAGTHCRLAQVKADGEQVVSGTGEAGRVSSGQFRLVQFSSVQ
jgi:hypothetical protein